jgi:DNA repair ATPase RecN
MDLNEKYGIATAASLVAALMDETDGKITELIVDNNKAQLLLALEQEFDTSVLELLDSILPITTTQHLVAYRWIDSEHFDFDELNGYNYSLNEAAENYQNETDKAIAKQQRFEQLRKHQIEADFSGDTNTQSLIEAVGCLINDYTNEPEVIEKLNELESNLKSQMNDVVDVMAVIDEAKQLLDIDATNYTAINSKLNEANQMLNNL